MFISLRSALAHLFAGNVAEPPEIAVLHVKYHRNLLYRVVFSLWVHEPSKNEIEEQDADVNSIAIHIGKWLCHA